MTITLTLAKQLLALAVAHAPPGKSIYSAEVMPECGTDPQAATCPLERVCDQPGLLCSPPRFSKSQGSWVRVESPETAVRRYALVTGSLVRVSRKLVSCRVEGELPDEDCVPVKGWPPGAVESLALAGLVTSVAEGGLREDVQYGRPPMGRGAAGEVGLAQLMPNQIPRFATWLPAEERERLANARRGELEAWIKTEIFGDQNLDKYFETALRALVQARANCKAGQNWPYAMWSRYGTGATCKASGKFAGQRSGWFFAWQHQIKKVALPEWAVAALEPAKQGASGEHLAVFPVTEP